MYFISVDIEFVKSGSTLSATISAAPQPAFGYFQRLKDYDNNEIYLIFWTRNWQVEFLQARMTAPGNAALQKFISAKEKNFWRRD